MKFGATLERSVADDWRGYAVDYSSLKQALNGQRRTAPAPPAGGDGPSSPLPPVVPPSPSGKPPLSPLKKSAGFLPPSGASAGHTSSSTAGGVGHW